MPRTDQTGYFPLASQAAQLMLHNMEMYPDPTSSTPDAGATHGMFGTKFP